MDNQTKNLIWRYVFHANQISFRFTEPHVDIPLQNSEKNFDKISKIDYTAELIKLYEKIFIL